MGERVVVITGASGRLGGVLAEAFAEAGDRIAALGRRGDALEALVARLPGGTGRHLALPVDLGDAGRTLGAAATVREHLGSPAALLHVVGSYRGETGIAEAPILEWAAMLDVNLWSTVHAVRAFLPDIRAAEHGRLVTVSTPFAAAPNAAGAAYSASKAAVEALTLSVARELAGTTATANVILVRTIGDAKPHHTRPAEIAAALLWLASPAAGVVNGQRIPLVGRA
ncbi:MAG TPA: SDR family oxidoreductase [Candidatus Sulfomarinibacteraceae bacterium]|nr:SDR family oxidoreductase [Candidatus Sulfomarinibacteraceae bacterium]